MNLDADDTISLSSISSSDEAELLTERPHTVFREDRTLQWSVLQMLVPFIYAVQKKENILAVILAFIVITGIIVHRPIRPATPDFFDLTDHMFIGAWLATNTYISLTITNPDLKIFALACAVCVCVCVVVLAFTRRQWPAKSFSRLCMHVLMHFSGALGTVILLYGSQNSISCSSS